MKAPGQERTLNKACTSKYCMQGSGRSLQGMTSLCSPMRCSGGGAKTQVNNGSKPLPFEFVSLYLRGKSDGFTLKGGDATKGTLDVQYDGPRPDPKIAGTCGKTGTYQPMRKKGAIILATGGDNSNSAMGKFCTL